MMHAGMRTIITSSVAVLFLGVYPILTERDSYPHSHLPMFSVRRTETARIDTAVAVSSSGDIQRLSPRVIADTDEVVMAKDAVVNAINSRSTDRLCAEIAKRIRSEKFDAVHVRVLTETYNAIAWFQGDKDPLKIDVHSECVVSP
jgi:hypothetical protein